MPDLFNDEPAPAVARVQRLASLLGLAALVALALTALVMDPGARDDAYMAPKWAWLAGWSGMALAAGIAWMAAGRAVMFPFSEVWVAALCLLAWHWIAVAWAPSRSLAIERAAHLGWATLALWAALQWLRPRRMLGWMAGLLVGVGCVTAAWVLLEDAVRHWAPGRVWLTPNLADWRGFLAAGLGNTNHLGDLLALAILAGVGLLGAARARRARAALLAALGLLAAGLTVCFSAGSNLGLVLGAAAMLGLVLWHEGTGFFRPAARWWGALAAVWLAVVLFFVLDHPLNPHPPGILAEGFGSGRWQAGGPTRLAIWAQTLEMIRLAPILGNGTGSFTFLFPEMDSALLFGRPELRLYQGMWTNAAHNAALQTWAETGIVGLFLFVALLVLAFNTLLARLAEAAPGERLARITLAGLLLAWCTQAQVNFAFQHPTGLLALYAILAAVVHEKRTRPREPMPPLRWETDWCALRLEWHSMRKPTAAGFALLLPAWACVAVAALALAGGAANMAWQARPVLAQREYRQAVGAIQANRPARAEAHFMRAFALDPDAHDIRSRYSVFLLDQRRPADALAQIAKVRERLNANELWEREARALALLGREDDARAAWDAYLGRVWRARAQAAAETGAEVGPPAER